MAKKGREARITRTIANIRGDKISLALQKRALSRPRAFSSLEEDAPKRSSWRRRKDRARVRAEARGDADAPHGYHGGARVLLVGDGNMTFALALTTLFGGMGRGWWRRRMRVEETRDGNTRGTKTCARRSRRAVGRWRTR